MTEHERKSAARNPNTVPHLLGELADSLDHWVRYWVATNQSAPVAALERLANDPWSVVRHGVAYNLNTPTHVLGQLADDPDSLVRRAVARHPRTWQ